MVLGRSVIDPSRSPAMLDTGTWDPAGAVTAISRDPESWGSLEGGAPGSAGSPTASSVVSHEGQRVFLAQLPDSQRVFLEVGPRGGGLLGKPFHQLRIKDGRLLSAYPTDASVINRFCRTLSPSNAPRALGRTPRIGIGTRMTTLLWPGVFAAMDEKGFAANTIQNSVRELNLLDDLRRGASPERRYASGFGMIESGYTGSTFEGLWVAGVLAALAHDRPVVYGADADHIQLKRTDPGLDQALRVVDAARYYTFFTIDAADVLSYGALTDGASGYEHARRAIPDERERREVLAWHTEAGRHAARIQPDTIGRCVDKFWAAFQALGLIVERLATLRSGAPYDLELAFDEHPPEIAGPDCITSDEELLFVAREVTRRGLPVTHLAPNFGVEKGFDYRLADGLGGLEKRVTAHQRIASELGFVLDVHSADDLSAATCKAIGRATGGKVHYKISPSLHLLFAQTVHDRAPEAFGPWWDDAVSYAREEARNGSRFAADCLAAGKPGQGTGHRPRRSFATSSSRTRAAAVRMAVSSIGRRSTRSRQGSIGNTSPGCPPSSACSRKTFSGIAEGATLLFVQVSRGIEEETEEGRA